MKCLIPVGFFLVCILILTDTTMAYTQPTLQTDLPLKYLVHTPAVPALNKPLIIFIHGFGTNEQDLFKMNKEFHPEYTYVSVRAPMDSYYTGAYQWFSLSLPQKGLGQIANEVNDSTTKLENFIKATVKKYKTTTEKTLLIGFSQGAIMAYEVALKNPLAVRGIAALSGTMLPIIQSQLTKGYDLKNLGVFIGHGTSDNRVPHSAGEMSYRTLNQTSIKPVFKSYQGLGHSINQEELKDLNNWMGRILETPRLQVPDVIFL